jgi:hypothetical protein
LVAHTCHPKLCWEAQVGEIYLKNNQHKKGLWSGTSGRVSPFLEVWGPVLDPQ